MSTAAALKQIASANLHLERAISSLVAFAPVPDYTESIEAAAHILDGLWVGEMSTAQRSFLREQTHLLARRAAEAEALFQSAGTLHFGSLLSQKAVDNGYAADGMEASYAGSAFHIDG